MTLSRISLTHFRNHASTTLEETRQFNLLVGENGAGKTNVLEALSLLSPGRGLRRASLPEMSGAHGPGGFAIGADLIAMPNGGQEATRLGTYAEGAAGNRRLVRVNGAQTSAASLAEWLSIGWLTPVMDRLFMESAGGRRRFIDRMTLALHPDHAQNAARYERALRERNRLLAAEHAPDPTWLDGIEAQMAVYGAALVQARTAMFAALTPVLEASPHEPFARPILTHVLGGPQDESALREFWRSERRRDRSAGRTLVGPHRGDFGCVMDGKDIPADQCSTGEQKAMLIAIILAHSTIASKGRANILLLDEVAAHLDPVRRNTLFARLRDTSAQIWLTGTEISAFEAVRQEAAIYRVDAGSLVRCE